jgi:RNA polymerase sigma-70 factor (ECF subfamily)
MGISKMFETLLKGCGVGEMEKSAENPESRSVWLQTRESLLRRLRGEGDAVDWEIFYKMYWRVIYSYGLRWGMPHQEAQDLVQEVMIKMVRTLPIYDYDRKRGRFLGWLKKVTKNTLIDKYKKQAKLHEVPIFDDDALMAAGNSDSWEEEWQDEILAQALERVTPRVSPQTSGIFQRYALEGASAETVASEFGVSVNTVYQARKNTIALLRKETEKLRQEI